MCAVSFRTGARRLGGLLESATPGPCLAGAPGRDLEGRRQEGELMLKLAEEASLSQTKLFYGTCLRRVDL
jgi:hypothetical protein